MKKLMIAAAAAAMIGGTQAVTVKECEACKWDPEIVDPAVDPEIVTEAAFYNVQFKVSTLTSKKISCKSDCPECPADVDAYYETGKRTVDGIMFKCDKCSDLDWNLVLWDKATPDAGLLTGDLAWAPTYDVYTTNAWWTASGNVRFYITKGAELTVLYTWRKYRASNVWDSDFSQPTEDVQTSLVKPEDNRDAYNPSNRYVWKYESTQITGGEYETKDVSFADQKLAFEGNSYASVEAALDAESAAYEYINGISTDLEVLRKFFKTQYPTAVAATIDEFSIDVQYAADMTTVEQDFWTSDCTISNDEFQRFGKTAQKVGTKLVIDADPFVVTAAGFGAYDVKNDVIKNISGNFAGVYEALPVELDEDPTDGDCTLVQYYGQFFDICEKFDKWCGLGNDVEIVPAYGTWTLKYNKSLKNKAMNKILPSFVTIQ